MRERARTCCWRAPRCAQRDRGAAVARRRAGGQLIRQLLTEGTLLALHRRRGGLLLACLGTESPVVAPAALPRRPMRSTCSRICGCSLFTLAVSRCDWRGRSGSRRPFRPRGPDLVGELKERRALRRDRIACSACATCWCRRRVALSLVALVGAGLFLRSLAERAARSVRASTPTTSRCCHSISARRVTRRSAARQFQQRVLERVSSVPGVQAASVASESSRCLPAASPARCFSKDRTHRIVAPAASCRSASSGRSISKRQASPSCGDEP